MTDYERELMANGTYLIKRYEIGTIAPPFIHEPPKRPVSPYAKFDKFHRKKKKK